MRITTATVWLRPLWVLSLVLPVTIATTAAFEARTRTVYVTAIDAKGAPVTELAPSDISVKEGGKDRAVNKIEPATERMHLAVLIQERLGGIDGVRTGLAQLIQPLLSQADVSIITAGLKNTTLVDYTSDTNALVKAINGLGTSPRATDEHLVEGLSDLTKQIQKAKLTRPVIVVIGLAGPQVTNVSANDALDDLRHSGAVMYAAVIDVGQSPAGTTGSGSNRSLGTLGQDAELDHLLGDGPVQSGGRRDQITGSTASGLTRILANFGTELQHQLAVSYTIPDGVKLDSRVALSLARKDMTLHAPTRIPDR